MSSKPTLSWIIAGMIMAISLTTHAYSPATHANLTEAAVNRSLLFDADLLESQQWGFQDLVGSSPSFPVAGPATSVLSVLELARRGAELEDSGGRAVNHFYDPQNDRGLDTAFADASPDWMIEGAVFNGFSMRDAYNYLEIALLGELTDPALSERDVSWGKVFRFLGHLSHHMQDMAQPQHVRNDEHCDIAVCKLLGRYGPSAYESETHDLRNSLETDGYPVVHLPRVRDYWSDSDETMGVAQLTATNFVSIDTNFRVDSQGNVITHPDFPEPLVNSLYRTTVPVDSIYPSIQSDAVFEFYGNSFTDPYTEEQIENPYLTAASLLVSPGGGQAFTLNAVTRESARGILTPRAVGYSAGIIDYFFRAKLEVQSFRQELDGRMRLDLKNTSHNGDYTYALDGTFDIYVNDPSTTGMQRIAGRSTYSPLKYGEEIFFHFDGSALASGPAIVVFNGKTVLSSDSQSIERVTTGLRISRSPENLVITEAMGWHYYNDLSTDDGTTSYYRQQGDFNYMIASADFDKPINGSVYNAWINEFGTESIETIVSYSVERWITGDAGWSQNKRFVYDKASPSSYLDLVRVGGIVEAYNYNYYSGEITCNTGEEYSFGCNNPLPDLTPTGSIDLLSYFISADFTEGEEFAANTFYSIGMVPPEGIDGLRLNQVDNRFTFDWAVKTLYFMPINPAFYHLDN